MFLQCCSRGICECKSRSLVVVPLPGYIGILLSCFGVLLGHILFAYLSRLALLQPCAFARCVSQCWYFSHWCFCGFSFWRVCGLSGFSCSDWVLGFWLLWCLWFCRGFLVFSSNTLDNMWAPSLISIRTLRHSFHSSKSSRSFFLVSCVGFLRSCIVFGFCRNSSFIAPSWPIDISCWEVSCVRFSGFFFLLVFAVFPFLIGRTVCVRY